MEVGRQNLAAQIQEMAVEEVGMKLHVPAPTWAAEGNVFAT